MLIKADAAQLEWRVKVFLAQDKVGMQEIEEVDSGVRQSLHTENMERFHLPNKTVAKNFLYRMIFADSFGPQGMKGPAYAYTNDSKFAPTSKSVKFWEKAIERFFEKYAGVYQHSVSLIRDACERGQVVSPSGRCYQYRTYPNWNGEAEWPRTQILNHIVQGFSADLMLLARKYIYEHWNPEWGLLINTVHDDVEADVHNDPGTIYQSSCLMEDAFPEITTGAKKWYGVDLNVTQRGEVKYGGNLHELSMSKFNRTTFYEDFKNLQ